MPLHNITNDHIVTHHYHVSVYQFGYIHIQNKAHKQFKVKLKEKH